MTLLTIIYRTNHKYIIIDLISSGMHPSSKEWYATLNKGALSAVTGSWWVPEFFLLFQVMVIYSTCIYMILHSSPRGDQPDKHAHSSCGTWINYATYLTGLNPIFWALLLSLCMYCALYSRLIKWEIMPRTHTKLRILLPQMSALNARALSLLCFLNLAPWILTSFLHNGMVSVGKVEFACHNPLSQIHSKAGFILRSPVWHTWIFPQLGVTTVVFGQYLQLMSSYVRFHHLHVYMDQVKYFIWISYGISYECIFVFYNVNQIRQGVYCWSVLEKSHTRQELFFIHPKGNSSLVYTNYAYESALEIARLSVFAWSRRISPRWWLVSFHREVTQFTQTRNGVHFKRYPWAKILYISLFNMC